ncbi:MAG TPA: hypothetical protein VIT64_15490 [Ilumatobacteraceae bacterium]
MNALIVLTAVIMLVAALGTWVERQALDTDNWVDASDELLADPEIQAALSAFIVNELYRTVDVSAQLEERLPENLARLAPTLATALQQPVTNAVDRLLGTEQVQTIWSGINQRAHESLVRILRGESRLDAVSTAEGAVTLDLGELVRNLAAELGLSQSVIDRIPADAGQVTLVRSDQLEAAQNAVTVVEWASVLLFLLVVAMFTAAVLLAQGWRRLALRNVGIAMLVVGLLVLVARRMLGNYLVDNFVEVEQNRDIAATVWEIATSLLRDIGWNIVAVAVLLVLAAVLGGPSRPARAIRRYVGPSVTARPAMLWGVASLLVLLLLLWAPLPVLETWWGALIAIAALAVAVEAFRRCCQQDSIDARRDEPSPSLTDAVPQPSP